MELSQLTYYTEALMNRILLPLALTAIVGTMMVAFATGGQRMRGQVVPQSATIAVEHKKPLRFWLTVSEGTAPAVVELSHDGKGKAGISVPSDWKLREVRGAALKDIAIDTPTFGFTRRAVPGGATLSFTVPAAPDGVILYNPSEVQLEVRLKRIHLHPDSVQTDAFLIKEAQKRLY